MPFHLNLGKRIQVVAVFFLFIVYILSFLAILRVGIGIGTSIVVQFVLTLVIQSIQHYRSSYFPSSILTPVRVRHHSSRRRWFRSSVLFYRRRTKESHFPVLQFYIFRKREKRKREREKERKKEKREREREKRDSKLKTRRQCKNYHHHNNNRTWLEQSSGVSRLC